MFTVDKEGVTFPTFEDTFSPTLLSLRKRAPLGIRFDPPRLFDVSVPPQLPRPPRVAPIYRHDDDPSGLRYLKGRTHATSRVSGLFPVSVGRRRARI